MIGGEDKLILELEALKESFGKTTDKIIKDLKRQNKIMERSDRRQRQEYDELQKRLQEVEALQKEIEDTQKEVVFTMGAIGESRSKETGNHVKRVAEYSRILAIHYGLPEWEAEMLKQASDTGVTPKPRLLYTQEELAEMRKLQAIAGLERNELTNGKKQGNTS